MNKDFQKAINELEKDIKYLKNTIEAMEQRIAILKELAWERDSKKESSKMYKVLENEKPSTIVKSNVGDVIVDREFMEKEIQKHLDNPALRGMVTSQEMLSFPKVARNVEAEFNKEYQGYNWRVKANDESIINYGERDYGKGHRLLTAHSRTERGERGQPHRQINDLDFHNSAHSDIIPQNYPLTQAELQRRLDINLNNHRRVSDEKQKQEFLDKANVIYKQANKHNISLDSKSLEKLKKANLTQINTNIKEKK